MSKLIALKSAIHETLSDAWFSDFSALKQEALLFDQIGIYKLGKFYKTLEETQGVFDKLHPNISNRIASVVTELEWLQQMGMVFDLTIEETFEIEPLREFAVKVPIEKFEDAKNLLKKIIEIQTRDLSDSTDEAHKANLLKEQHFAAIRLMSIIIEITKGVTAVTTFPYTEYVRELPSSQKSSVAQIVISKLPLPSNDTPWEKVIDYRSGTENQNNLLNLRRWIRKFASENSSLNEIEEELEWLINEFQTHMRLHKMKANTETLEVIVKTPLETVENLLKLKLSKLPEPLFALKKRQISLMEAELNAPGREMAYIVKAKNVFQS